MLGRSGGRLPERVREGTWLGHVAEHAAIEVQRLVGIPVSFGRTRETRTPGVYNLVYEMEEERVGVRAGKLALDVVEHCAGIYGEAMDLEQRLDGLKRLREKWALGPSTKSIVDTAAARGIPWLRLNDRSLRMLGYGVNQRKIQATIASTTAHLEVEIAGDKDLTKRLLGDQGVPVPKDAPTAGASSPTSGASASCARPTRRPASTARRTRTAAMPEPSAIFAPLPTFSSLHSRWR